MALTKEFLKIYQRRERGKKKMVKQLPMKIINCIGRKVLAVFSHFYPMIHMRCVANYNHSKLIAMKGIEYLKPLGPECP